MDGVHVFDPVHGQDGSRARPPKRFFHRCSLGASPSLSCEKDSTGMTRLGDRMVAKKKGGGMLEWLAANWTTIVGTLIGIGVGAYFGLKGWRHKKLIYVVGGSNIFSGLEHTVPDVEVKFSGYGQ